MLTVDEKNYLAKIDPERKVQLYPYSKTGKLLGEQIVAKIHKKLPHLEVVFMGSIALEISGQKDIDIYILSDPKDFDLSIPSLRNLFGEPAKNATNIKSTFIEWKFIDKGYEVEIYLTEPPERQIKVFQILSTDKSLLKEYEDLKSKFNGKSYKDYQKAKYEFYNRILSGN